MEQRHLLSTVELPPKKGGQTHFWQGEQQYAISALQLTVWAVLMFRPWGKADILVTFVLRDGAYVEQDPVMGAQNPVDDWRQIVRHYV
jgi:hypothetical protein